MLSRNACQTSLRVTNGLRTLATSLVTIAAVVGIGYVIILALVYAFQDRLLYFPSSELETDPAAIGMPFEDLWLIAKDGVRVHAWYIPAARQTDKTVLFLHGNAGNISHRMYTVEVWHQLGFNALLLDYRGYGRSDGTSSEQGLRDDALAAWHYLIEQRTLAPEAIVVHGRSLGAAVALSITDVVKPAALITESGFKSLPEVAAQTYPWLPVH